MNRTALVCIALGGAILVVAVLVRWVSPLDPPITNGVLRETARLDVSDYVSIVVPETATVERGKQTSCVEILLEKELAFRGHPPSPVHIERARDYFGAAYKREDDALVLATYGESTGNGLTMEAASQQTTLDGNARWFRTIHPVILHRHMRPSRSNH